MRQRSFLQSNPPNVGHRAAIRAHFERRMRRHIKMFKAVFNGRPEGTSDEP